MIITGRGLFSVLFGLWITKTFERGISMPKYLRPALVFGIIAAGMIALWLSVVNILMLMVLGFICAAVAIVFLIMAAVSAVSRHRGKGKEPSGWKLFAIGDITVIVLLAIVGLADIISAKDSTFFGPGMLGAILFYYGLPILAALLVVELLLWNVTKPYREDSGSDKGRADGQESGTMPPRIAYPQQSDNDGNGNDNG